MAQDDRPVMDRIFFSHIPKNGGMAIRYFLRNQVALTSLCPHEEPQSLMRAQDLSPFSLFQGHLHYDFVQMLPPANVISFFREPVARTLSLLLHLRRDPNFHALYHRAKDRSISDLLNDEEITRQIVNQQTAYLGTSIQFSALKRDLATSAGMGDIGAYLSEPSIKLALNRLQRLSLIGLVENMGESLNRLCQQYHFHPCMDYAKRNHAGASDQQLIAHLSVRDMDKIKALNHLDVELYDAAQALFHQRPEAFSYGQLVRESFQRQGLTLTEDSTLDLGAPLKGTNWFRGEFNEGGTGYRWSGPAQQSSLEFPLWIESCELLQVTVYPRAGDDIANTLKLYLNGELMPSARRHQDDNGVVFEVDVKASEASRAQGFHQLVFEHDLDVTQLPQNGDERVLHFCLTSVRIIGAQPPITPVVSKDKMFTLDFKVRDYECDLQGVVNNSVYQNYLEHARHEFLLSKGIDFAELARQKINLVVLRAELDYKAPLVSGDEFYIDVVVAQSSRVRFDFLQNIYRKSDNKLMLAAKITGTSLNERGRPFVPEAIAALMDSVVED